MKTSKKIIFTLIMVIISLFLYEVITYYQAFIGLNWKLFSLSELPLGDFIPYFYFYGGITILFGILVYLVLMWFYIDRHDVFTLSEDKKGKLQLKSSAIESYVNIIIKENQWIDDAKVTVNSKKDKIFIDISGYLRRTSGLVGQTELLIEKIQTDLKTFLGIKKDISMEITFKDITNQKNISTKSKRVE